MSAAFLELPAKVWPDESLVLDAFHEEAILVNALFDAAAEYRDHGKVSPVVVAILRDALSVAGISLPCGKPCVIQHHAGRCEWRGMGIV